MWNPEGCSGKGVCELLAAPGELPVDILRQETFQRGGLCICNWISGREIGKFFTD